MKHLLFLFLTIISHSLFSQIKIDQSGEGWKEMVESAMLLIEKTDPEKYEHLKNNVTKIGFWAGSYSSSEGTEIVISRDDILLNSVENIACVLIHEAKHIELRNSKMSLGDEECVCYLYELEFIKKLNDPKFLLENCLLRLNQYECNI
jgi:hypothetical protein